MNARPDLSVVVPVFNEAGNLERLTAELAAALAALDFEVLIVDDGSDDGSEALYPKLEQRYPWLRVVRHPRNAGQSAAFVTGVSASRAPVLATIDGDLQNDPADIPRLLEVYRSEARSGDVLVAGRRTRRMDSLVRRWSSRIANRVRSALLKDGCQDTGCSLKLFARRTFLRLPQFDHMHRFLPALFVRDGARVVNVDVNHRPRGAGESKYGIGNRLWVGIMDLLGTRWLMQRAFVISGAEREALGPEQPDG